MREIKFRVWCEFEFSGNSVKCMESEASWFLLTQIGKLWTRDPGEAPRPLEKEYKKTIPLFYTGVKDFDKIEIYEGDIIEFYNVQYTKEKKEVKFVNNNDYCGWNISPNFVLAGNARIVGNVYENPELLKE